MTIRVDLQLNNNPHCVFTPGHQIRGEVLVTTSQPIKVRGVRVELVGRLWVDGSYFLDTLEPEVTAPTSCEPEFPASTSCGNEHACHRDQNSTTSKRNRDLTIVLTTLKSAPIEETQWNPGVHKVPFVVDIPNDDYLPVFTDSCVRVNYDLKAFVDTPVPLLSFFSWSTTSYSMPFYLGEQLSNLDLMATRTPLIRSTSTSVGEWDESSSTAGALLKFAVGVDTAKKWYPLEVRFCVPELVAMTANTSYYLSDGCSLSVTPLSTVEIDINVREITLRLVTRVQVSRPEIRGALVFSTNILSEKRSPLLINQGAQIGKPIDLTPLLSAARIPSSVGSSVNRHPLLVTHELQVDLKFRSEPANDVRQSSSTVKIVAPLRINNHLQPCFTNDLKVAERHFIDARR